MRPLVPLTLPSLSAPPARLPLRDECNIVLLSAEDGDLGLLGNPAVRAVPCCCCFELVVAISDCERTHADRSAKALEIFARIRGHRTISS